MPLSLISFVRKIHIDKELIQDLFVCDCAITFVPVLTLQSHPVPFLTLISHPN